MRNYQATPDYYREYIEHGWLKDQAAKTHKYIKKYVNKAGNTIYVYARKAQTAINRKLNRVNPDQISLNYGKEPVFGYSHDNGKATSRTGHLGNLQDWRGKYHTYTSFNGKTKGIKVNSGIAAGRRRTKYWNKTKTNLSSKGYSNSNSPKGSWTVGKSKFNTYDAPDSIEKVFDSSGYYRRKGRNDAQVARGIYSGRKRRAK